MNMKYYLKKAGDFNLNAKINIILLGGTTCLQNSSPLVFASLSRTEKGLKAELLLLSYQKYYKKCIG